MVDILHLNSTSLSHLNPKGLITSQPCFTYRANGSWIFNDIHACQFHTDSMTDALNTYFLDCAREKNIIQEGWQGNPIDLVYEQLNNLLDKTSGNLILVLSSIYSKIQIEYLSGILKELSNSMVIIPAPLAYIYSIPSGRYAAIEIEMHDTVLTKIDIVDGFATIKTSKIFPNFGLQYIYNAQYSVIKNEFIRRYRYDPDHVTVNKDKLLKQLCDQCHNSNVAQVHLEADNYRISIERESLKQTLPEQLLNELGDRECWLVPLSLIPIQYMIPEVPVLPSLNTKHTDALMGATRQPSTEMMDTDSIKIFRAVSHQQIT